MKTVEDILLSGENLEIGSDSDISDASQIRKNFSFFAISSFTDGGWIRTLELGITSQLNILPAVSAQLALW